MRNLLRNFAAVATLTAGAHTSAEPPKNYTVSIESGRLTILPSRGWRVDDHAPWATRGGPSEPWIRNFSTLPFAATATDLGPGRVQFFGGICDESRCHRIRGEAVMP